MDLHIPLCRGNGVEVTLGLGGQSKPGLEAVRSLHWSQADGDYVVLNRVPGHLSTFIT